ncbi:MAG: hypothetical protein ACRD5F_16200, partial [Candidatus Acidiferrales bacterium]
MRARRVRSAVRMAATQREAAARATGAGGWSGATKRLCAAGGLMVIGAAALVGLLALSGPPQARADRPAYFAIRGARIVPVSGPMIESGTVVIANGLIAAVGANAAIPPEAWVIEGKGLTVYPGLIDAMTNIGQPAAPARAGAAPGAGPQ